MNIKNFISALQNQPEEKRKLILWAATILLGIILAGWWVKGIANKLPEMKEAKDNLRYDLGVPQFPSLEQLQSAKQQ